MGGRGVGQPRRGQLPRPHAFPVHGDGDHLRPGRQEDLTREAVARVLHRDSVPGVEQQPRAKIEALLRAVDHDDLLRFAAEPTGPPQIALQGRPEVGRAAGIAIPEARLSAQQGGADRLPPGEHGKVGGGQVPVAEVRDHQAPAGHGRQGELRQPLAVSRQPVGKPRRPRLPRCHGRRAKSLRHLRPGSLPGLQVSLRDQLLVGRGHRRARDAPLRRQRPRGGQPSTGTEQAGGDLALDRFADPLGDTGLRGCS
jgi:hypothetical protein